MVVGVGGLLSLVCGSDSEKKKKKPFENSTASRDRRARSESVYYMQVDRWSNCMQVRPDVDDRLARLRMVMNPVPISARAARATTPLGGRGFFLLWGRAFAVAFASTGVSLLVMLCIPRPPVGRSECPDAA